MVGASLRRLNLLSERQGERGCGLRLEFFFGGMGGGVGRYIHTYIHTYILMALVSGLGLHNSLLAQVSGLGLHNSLLALEDATKGRGNGMAWHGSVSSPRSPSVVA